MDIVFQATEETVWDRAEWSDAKEAIYQELKADTVDYILDLIRKGERPSPTIGLDLIDEPPPYSFEPTVKWLMVSRITRSADTYYVTATYFGASCRYPNRKEEPPHGSLFDREEYVSAWCNGVMTARPRTAPRRRKRSTYNQLEQPATPKPAGACNALRPSAAASRSIVGILATKGGVGKSMMAIHLAITAARRHPVIVLNTFTATPDESEVMYSFSRPELNINSEASCALSDGSPHHRQMVQCIRPIGLRLGGGKPVVRPTADVCETGPSRALERQITMKSSAPSGVDRRISSTPLRIGCDLDNAESGVMRIELGKPLADNSSVGDAGKKEIMKYGLSRFSIRTSETAGLLGMCGLSAAHCERKSTVHENLARQ